MVTRTATAYPGWMLEAWSGNLSGTDDVITHTITCNVTVFAILDTRDFKLM